MAAYKANNSGPRAKPPLLTQKENPVLPRSVGDNGCPDGYKGPDCKNPICNNETWPFYTHDGLNDGFGDTIEFDIAPTCSERFTIPLDISTPLDVYITVTSDVNGSYPYSRLFDTKMKEIIPCGDTIINDRSTLQKYCQVLSYYGEGFFTLRLSGNTVDMCSFQVEAPTFLYPDGGFVVSPQNDVIQASLPGPNQAITQNPIDGIPSYLAFKMTHDVYPVAPQIVHFYSNGAWIQSENLIARFQCSTPHITIGTFTCSAKNSYYVKFQGIDDNGYPWQRLYDFDCESPPPTTLPPSTTTPPLPVYPTCSNEVPKVDLILAFDSSATMDQLEFTKILDKFYDLASLVQFGPTQTRAILGTYDGAIYFNNQHFTHSATMASYLTRLVELMYTGYTGNMGNNVLSLFNYVQGLQKGVDAFRSNTRKIVFYVSTTNCNEDPTNVAQQLKSQGVEFFPIAYGPTGNFTQAWMISPKCAHLATSDWLLQDAINYFFSLLCSSTPTC
ncbi:unnamed protein product, partial [Mesorhabditis belari]|uniref:VWFA domain-containing protein n=1 Tax=Mesorhabditis belari TaxID=2138241 RepID=A0AAF3J2J3_9BILA